MGMYSVGEGVGPTVGGFVAGVNVGDLVGILVGVRVVCAILLSRRKLFNGLATVKCRVVQ